MCNKYCRHASNATMKLIHSSFCSLEDVAFIRTIMSQDNCCHVNCEWTFRQKDCRHFVILLHSNQTETVISYRDNLTATAWTHTHTEEQSTLLLLNKSRSVTTKGQIISECPYDIIVSPKIPTKKFPRFLPQPLRRGQIKNFIKPIMLNNP